MRVRKPQKPIAVTCIDCGTVFIGYSRKAKRCPECREKRAKEYRKNYNGSLKSNRKMSVKHNIYPKMTLSEVLRELRIYNKENNTNLSYGQFVLILEGKR